MVRLILFLPVVFLSVLSFGQLTTIPKIFDNHMVLQRDQPVRIWGWDSPRNSVTVIVDGVDVKTKANSSGEWECILPAHTAGGPFNIVVLGSKEIVIQDVYFGDLWLVNGFADPEWRLGWKQKDKKEIKTAEYPQIRYFEMPPTMAVRPQTDLGKRSQWTVAFPSTVETISSVPWYFAKLNYLEKGVPVGIISMAWEDAPIETWISPELLANYPRFEEPIRAMTDPSFTWKVQFQFTEKKTDIVRSAADKNRYKESEAFLRDFDDKEWKQIKLPSQEPLDGFSWLRKKVELGRFENAFLHLGDVKNKVTVFLNGKIVPLGNWDDTQQAFLLPADKLRNGENTIALRLADPGNEVVISGEKEQLWIESNGVRVSLSGLWRYSDGGSIQTSEKERKWYPGTLYNGMIHPITNMSLKGVLWIRNEVTPDSVGEYEDLFRDLVDDWRMNFKQGRFPFIYAYLNSSETIPGLDMNELMVKEITRIPKSRLVSAVDLGLGGIFPNEDRQDLGRRLWVAASELSFHDQSVKKGPVYKNHLMENGVITIEFDGADLKSEKQLVGFELAGDDGVFYKANGKVDKNKAVIKSDLVPFPRYIRYGWVDTGSCNLYSVEGLPASPFVINF